MQQELIGTIINTEGDSILIGIQDEGSCHSCGLHGICGDKKLSVQKTKIQFTAKSGDRVGVSYSKVLRSSALLYLMPLVAFFLGLFLVDRFFPGGNELWQFVGGSFGLVLALLFLRASAAYFKKNDYQIQITKIT